MDLLLKNKVILVTGASKGLGFACAQSIAEEGANVIISSRNLSNLGTASSKIKGYTGFKPEFFASDVSKLNEINELKKWVIKEFGRVDGLVINAGGPPTGLSLSLSEEDWISAIDTNFLSVIRLTKTFVPVMQKQKYGKIAAINSVSAKQPLSNLVLSNSTRLGVIGYLKTVSNEFAQDNILINAVLPGLTRTKRLEEVMKKWAEKENKSIKKVEEERTASIPMGRLGEPQELASLVCFLVSGRNSYITGQVIAVDGGFIKSAL
ncbi:MAG: SDR family oxidoreductase [Promethearchaeota archaeon]